MSEIKRQEVRLQATDVVSTDEKHLDPICGMTVDKQTAAGSFEHQGTTYYFCCDHCLETFRRNPVDFLQPKTQLVGLNRAPKISSRAAKTSAAEYTCPMHPEIVREPTG